MGVSREGCPVRIFFLILFLRHLVRYVQFCFIIQEKEGLIFFPIGGTARNFRLMVPYVNFFNWYIANVHECEQLVSNLLIVSSNVPIVKIIYLSAIGLLIE